MHGEAGDVFGEEVDPSAIGRDEAGYHVEGGAVDVGKASTVSVVYSIVILLIANLLITQMLLS